jgi:hypothetical protein
MRSRGSDWISKRCNTVETQSLSNTVKIILRSWRREEHDAVEVDLKSLRDKLAVSTIELQQKEDEI